MLPAHVLGQDAGMGTSRRARVQQWFISVCHSDVKNLAAHGKSSVAIAIAREPPGSHPPEHRYPTNNQFQSQATGALRAYMSCIELIVTNTRSFRYLDEICLLRSTRVLVSEGELAPRILHVRRAP